MRIFIVPLMLSLVLALPQHAQDNTLSSVKRIQVGPMSRSDEAERFRLLLQGELGKRAFLTVDDPQQADAVLTGALVVRVYARDPSARVTVELKTPNGSLIWGKDFAPHVGLGTSDPVKRRAQDVASELRRAIDAAVKSGARRTLTPKN